MQFIAIYNLNLDALQNMGELTLYETEAKSYMVNFIHFIHSFIKHGENIYVCVVYTCIHSKIILLVIKEIKNLLWVKNRHKAKK